MNVSLPPIALSPPALDKYNVPEYPTVATCAISGSSSNSEKEYMMPKGRDARPRGLRSNIKEEESQEPIPKRRGRSEESRVNKQGFKLIVKR